MADSRTDRVLELLKTGRETLSDPKRWCKFYFARTEYDEETGTKASNAVKWCARGALMRQLDLDDDLNFSSMDSFAYNQVNSLLEEAVRTLPKNYRSLVDLNDSGTHEEVLQVFDQAIEWSERGL